jgi:hypothetical protein
MKKIQAWIAIGLLIIVVAILGAQYENRNKTALGSAWACYDDCQVAALKSNGTESLILENSCEADCFSREGLTAPWTTSTKP